MEDRAPRLINKTNSSVDSGLNLVRAYHGIYPRPRAGADGTTIPLRHPDLRLSGTTAESLYPSLNAQGRSRQFLYLAVSLQPKPLSANSVIYCTERLKTANMGDH